MKRTYLPTDGVSLASIVAKGTHNNDWNGAGVGVGSGGLVVGGAAGQSISRSELARNLGVLEKAPKLRPADYNVLAIPMFFIMLLFMVMPVMNIEKYQMITSITLIVLGIACTTVYGIYFSGARNKEIKEENASLKREYELKKTIYYRLRFVEADFVVFDPVTGYWDYAEKEKLISLIKKIKEKYQ
ncbi:hypothetical protein OKT76_17485 [Providencia rettgeri]|uniref:hypothetical protein n=1 Tax=Providencia TaxID=586 RepID=UPI0018C843EB|nr:MULTISPECIES: hypothetical protein [Providencia]MBG5925297.1 hypothetical protein [Providencia rettgeri]MCX9097519.1 hypothetical protein [Providencia rettgeri]HCT9039556.1 hypothetical protein [Providencia rettgeri]HEM7189393.1 hypothetical protein [Providencia rettgeri]HEM8213026.1 hypothetical protein [Providencia rettgeri]